MDDFVLQKLEITTHEMPHKGFRFILTDSLCCPVIIEILLEVSIFTVFQNYVKMFPTSEAVMHFDDKRRRYGLEGGDLAFDLLLDVISQGIDVDDFDSDFLSIFALSKVDSSAGSFSE